MISPFVDYIIISKCYNVNHKYILYNRTSKPTIIIIVCHMILTYAAIWTTVTRHLSRRQGGSVLWASFPSSFADKSDMSLSLTSSGSFSFDESCHH